MVMFFMNNKLFWILAITLIWYNLNTKLKYNFLMIYNIFKVFKISLLMKCKEMNGFEM